MSGGYMGKLLEVDLSRGRFEDREHSKELLRKYIGGLGLGAQILFDRTSKDTDPLGEGNVLMFLTGPLTNTKVPTSGRYAVVAKSPLGIWGESDSGGTFGPGLKESGYDGIVISGRSEDPVYLYIDNGTPSIRKAKHLWGKDTYQTDILIKEETSPKAVTAVIGPAGENLAKIAGIINDGKNGRLAGRGGLGAVMGSKNLKAIAVHGEMKPAVAEQDLLRHLIKKISKRIIERTSSLKNYGTAGAVLVSHEIGDLPIKNFTLGEWQEKIKKISGQQMAKEILKRRFYCGSCIIGCGRIVQIKEGQYAGSEMAGPEYETLGALGSLLMISDLKAIAFGHELCNRYGMDVISAGMAIAFAVEAFEGGLITKKDTDGIDLAWGDSKGMIKLLHKMGTRQGIGHLLTEGVRYASKQIGPPSENFALHVKGLELPMHDPRSLSSFAVSFATSPRGACHRGCSQYLERFGIPELQVDEPLERQQDKGKGQISAIMQDYSTLFNSLKLCHFIIPATTPSEILSCFKYVTGWDIQLNEFLDIGERIFNLKKLYNLKMGLTKKDDTLPARIRQHKLIEGGAKNYIPDLDKMLQEYYDFRGWDSEGNPKIETLDRLDLHNESRILSRPI